MKITEKIREWLNRWHETQRINNWHFIQKDAYETVQLKEYNGKPYIAINNIAYIPVDEIRGDACEVIIKARQTYIEQQWQVGKR